MRSEISSKSSPYDKIGGALVDGLSAFEEVVEKIEELCLNSIPFDLRIIPALEDESEIALQWRMRLAPGLDNLQREAEETKSEFVI